MTKKDFTSLIVVFLGAWLLFQALFNLLSPVLLTVSYAIPGIRDGGRMSALAVGIASVFIYTCVGLLVIRKAASISGWLLRRANIAPDGRMDGVAFDNFLPLAISMLGLCFFIRYLPDLVINGVKWFAYEAKSSDFLAVGGTGQVIGKIQSNMAYNGAFVAVSAFVFLRAEFLAGRAAKYGKIPGRSPDPTPDASAPAANPPPHQL